MTRERFLELVTKSCTQIPAHNFANMVYANRRHIRVYLEKALEGRNHNSDDAESGNSYHQ